MMTVLPPRQDELRSSLKKSTKRASYSQERRTLLLNEVRKAVSLLLSECLSPPRAVINSTPGASALCASIEAILSHSFKVPGRNYWYFVKKSLSDKGTRHRDTIEEVRKAWWNKHQIFGKGRAWICIALNSKLLFECMQILTYESLSVWYEDNAFLRNSHDSALLFQLLMPIFDIEFNLQAEEELFSYSFQDQEAGQQQPQPQPQPTSPRNQNAHLTRSAKIKRRGYRKGVIEDAEEAHRSPTGDTEVESSPRSFRSLTMEIPRTTLPLIMEQQQPQQQHQSPHPHHQLERRNTIQADMRLSSNRHQKNHQQQKQQHNQQEGDRKVWAPEIEKLFKVGSCEERLKMMIQNNHIEKILTGESRPRRVTDETHATPVHKHDSDASRREPQLPSKEETEHKSSVEGEKEEHTSEREERTPRWLEALEKDHQEKDREKAKESDDEEQDDNEAEQPSSFQQRIIMNRMAKVESRRNTVSGTPEAPIIFEKQNLSTSMSIPSPTGTPSAIEIAITSHDPITDPYMSADRVNGSSNGRSRVGGGTEKGAPTAWGKRDQWEDDGDDHMAESGDLMSMKERKKAAMAVPSTRNSARITPGASYGGSVKEDLISASLQDKFLDSCEQLVDFLSSSYKNKLSRGTPTSEGTKQYQRNPNSEETDSDYSGEGGEDSNEDYDEITEQILEFVYLRMKAFNSNEPGADPVGEDKRKWQDSSKCTECLLQFNPVRRKHHCRNCGGIVCRRCSLRRCALAGFYKPVRVCNTCWGAILDASIQSSSLTGGEDEDLRQTV